MHIAILGPLDVRHDQHSVVPSAAKSRKVLATLVVQPGQVVTVPTLIDELWGDDPPRTAATTLQTYIRHLRVNIAGAGYDAREVIGTRASGYVFADPDPHLDAREFERLAHAGQDALRAGDEATAAVQLDRALALWRGPALVDVPAGRVLEVEILRLEELRLTAQEACFTARLRLGQHREVLGELAASTARHPFHESLHALLMLALHRCGRQSEALAAFRRLRAALTTELGLEPCQPLQRLHRDILGGQMHELGAEGLLATVRTATP